MSEVHKLSGDLHGCNLFADVSFKMEKTITTLKLCKYISVSIYIYIKDILK